MKHENYYFEKKNLLPYILIAFLFFGLYISEVKGEEEGWKINQWVETSGPAGGKITSVEVDPYNSERMFATTPWGLFKSSNQGNNWFGYGFSQDSLNVVKFHPHRRGVVFVGGEDGIYKSYDQGDNWEHLIDELGTEEVYAMDFSPFDRDMLVVGTDDGIYISEDGGESFDKLKQTPSPALEVKIYRQDSSQIYVGTEDDGLFITTNRGENWRNIGEDLPGSILAIEANPFDNNLIFVGTSYGIYRTGNAGDISPRWTSTGALGSKVEDIWIDLTNPSQIFAGTSDQGILRSHNLGESWLSPIDNLPELEVLQIIHHPSQSGEIYLATANNGVIKLNDELSDYDYLNDGISAHITDIKASNKKRDHLMAITENGLYMSENKGDNWDRVFDGSPEELFLTSYGYDIDFLDKDINFDDIFDDIPDKGEVLHVIEEDKIKYTFDWGEDWKEISTQDLDSGIIDLTVNPLNPKEIWAGTKNGIYVFSEDKTWEKAGDYDLYTSNLDIVYSYAKDELVIYATSHNELYKSEDNGGNFEQLDGTDEDIAPTEISVNPLDKDEFWIGTYSQGIFYSDDGGQTLTRKNEGISYQIGGEDKFFPTVHTLKQKPDMPGNLFVGLESGVYFTNTKGETWNEVEQLQSASTDLAVSFKEPTSLYLGTKEGVIKFDSYEIPYLGWEKEDYYELKDPNVYRLEEIFNLKNNADEKVSNLMFKTPAVVEHGRYQFLYDSHIDPWPNEFQDSQETLPGNEKIKFENEQLPPGEQWEIRAENTVVSFGIEFDIDKISPEPYDEESELYQTFTSSSLMSDPQESRIEEQAREIVGDEDNPLEKAKLIFRWVQDHMEYVPPGNVGATRALEDGEGVCADYSDLFVALARASDIPARRLSGYYLTGESEGQFHAWAEFYLEGYGWIPVEATFEGDEEFEYFGKLEPRHVFMSWDVVRQEYSDVLDFEEEFKIEEIDLSDKGWDIEEPFEYQEHDFDIEKFKDLEPPEDFLSEGEKLIYFVIDRDQFYLEDELLELDSPPYLKNDRTMVPVRFIAESLDSQVKYDEDTEEVEILYDDKQIKLYLGDKTVELNGEQFELDVEPEIKNDRTMVPLRFINESLGAEVNYDEDTKEIFIIQK
ncbi:stalk domain-containing protein [Natranaerofaba carboxydovora]|uniref:stalk domain-containing protein n=1 Tax=Natranaerofaba carboxydovora TaxID=2742683 RepID=UPI001F12BEC4|nr:stalk domain-containing protein [Natranaerofaba carboxydovora]UMZ75081.1 hypothetical protein ACONDI_02693 [Natranaerofaba carboxydovora]